MSPPSLTVSLPLEGRPQIIVHCPHKGDDVRLADWLSATPGGMELCDLIERWRQAPGVPNP